METNRVSFHYYLRMRLPQAEMRFGERGTLPAQGSMIFGCKNVLSECSARVYIFTRRLRPAAADAAIQKQ